MSTNDKQVEILNDLVQINNDRIAGYEKAINGLEAAENEDLKVLFHRLINRSVDYNEELEKHVGLMSGEPATGTSGAGKLYRVWMEFKALVTGGDRLAILESCITGEETAIRAYGEALTETGLVDELKELLSRQLFDIRQSRFELDALRQALE